MATEPLFSLATNEHCFSVRFHPSEPLLAAATITGEVEVFRFDATTSSSECVRKWKIHEDSCRAARWLGSGSDVRLASTSADESVALSDAVSGNRIWHAKMDAAGSALIAMDDGHRLVVGDDDGAVKIFDVRTKDAVAEFSEHEDFVSDMAMGTDGFSVCATSGDGKLGVYDTRKTGVKGLIAMSDFLEDEYLSVDIVRQGRKVVCGSQSGVLALFSWGDFGDMKDRIRGHPMSIDSICRLADDAVLTGSSDGNIRVVSVHSKKHGNAILGILAEHSDMPIECLTMSPDEGMVASVSHGTPAVRVWSTDRARALLDGKVPIDGVVPADDEEPDSDDSDEPRPKKKLKRQKRRKGLKGAAADATQAKAANFFSGL